LPFCNFFRRLGNLVAGFLATRLSLFAIARPPLDQGSSSDFSLYREARAGSSTPPRPSCPEPRCGFPAP
jgi:hypothetical protein